MSRSAALLTTLAVVAGLFVLGYQATAQTPAQTPEDETRLAQLGEMIFFDEDLSVNGKQSCATCHAPETGYTGPDSATNLETGVYPGAIATRYGNRKPPSAAYVGDNPVLYYDEEQGKWLGGLFWDGRATGWTLGDPLAEQAQGPFLNPLEQAMPNARLVAIQIARSEYADLFEEVWGPGSLDHARDLDGTYERIARSIAAYERSADVSPYTSKFDQFWDNAVAAGLDVAQISCPGEGPMGNCGMGGGGGMGPGGGGGMGPGGGGGMGPGGPGGGTTGGWAAFRGLGLTDQELRGLAAFNDPGRANCASCHSLEPGPNGYPLFTNFGYDNLGVPKNPENPFYTMPRIWNPDGADWVDYGLGAFLENAGYAPEVYEPELGKQKVPTLRNADLRPSEDFVKAYGHNGYFESLEEIILFYAWRGLTMNGGLGIGGLGWDCGGGPGGGGMGGGGMNQDMEMMCDPDLFPQPEANLNLTPMNHFNMMDQVNIAAFLRTLSDGHFER